MLKCCVERLHIRAQEKTENTFILSLVLGFTPIKAKKLTSGARLDSDSLVLPVRIIKAAKPPSGAIHTKRQCPESESQQTNKRQIRQCQIH